MFLIILDFILMVLINSIIFTTMNMLFKNTLTRNTLFKPSFMRFCSTKIGLEFDPHVKKHVSNLSINIYRNLKEASVRTDELNQQIMDMAESQMNVNPENIIKEIARISGRVSMFKELDESFQTIKDCEDILQTEEDSELKEMAQEELEEAIEEIEETQEKAVQELVPISELDEKNVTLEVKSAAGGSESALFADDLKGMYESYCRNQGWRWTQKHFSNDATTGKG